MPAIVPIVVETTQEPTTQFTFNPQEIRGDLAVFRAQMTDFPVGDAILTTSLTRSTKQNKANKVRIRVVIPRMVKDSLGADTSAVDHSDFADITFSLSDLSSSGQRQDLTDCMVGVIAVVAPELVAELNKYY